MLKKSSIIIIVLFVLYFVFRVFIVTSCSSKDIKYTEELSFNNAYIGDPSCKKCHTSEQHQWKQSDHYMSMLPANDSTVKGDFNNVTFTADGITSKFYKKGSKFFINTEGNDGKNHDFEVKYIFGYKPLQQYLVSFPGGRMQVPRLSWDVNKKNGSTNMQAKKSLHTIGCIGQAIPKTGIPCVLLAIRPTNIKITIPKRILIRPVTASSM